MKNKFIKEWLPYIIIIIIVIIIRTYFYTPIRVNQTSMYPTLKQNDLMILSKIGLKKGINRFEIVVIKTSDNYIIKRVIGLPGESIAYIEGKLYINGKHIEDDYVKSNMEDFDEVILKDDEYFVMGDNREVSKDSRDIGPVKEKQILGKTDLVIFPFNKIGKVK